MAEIIRVYRQKVGALRFVGKKYGDNDRVDGMFGAKWEDWHTNGLFNAIEKQINGNQKEIYEDGDAYIGLMRFKENEPFEYWIGMFMPTNMAVPDGYECVNFPESELGVCWVYGKDGEVYMEEERCADRLRKEGFEVITDEKGAYWFFERYGCPRFTEPDEKGNIILDVCHYIK